MRIPFPLSYATNWPFSPLVSCSSPTIAFIGYTDGFISPSSTNTSTNHIINGSVRLYTFSFELRSPIVALLVPTPFASHAFHPLDGYLQSVPYHLFIFLFPIHRLVYLILFVLVNMWTIFVSAYLILHSTHLQILIRLPDPWFRYDHWPFPGEIHQRASSSYTPSSIFHCKLWTSEPILVHSQFSSFWSHIVLHMGWSCWRVISSTRLITWPYAGSKGVEAWMNRCWTIKIILLRV